MDRAGALPDRCIACNQPAGGYRLRRKLYRSPFLWKVGAFAAPFAALYIGLGTQTEWLMMSFWPLVVILIIAHFFVRKSVKVEYGVCERHRRLRQVLMALSILGMAGVFAGIFGFSAIPGGPFILLGSLAGLVVLMVAQSYAGVQALALQDVSPEYAWLSGTGELFRNELPELN